MEDLAGTSRESLYPQTVMVFLFECVQIPTDIVCDIGLLVLFHAILPEVMKIIGWHILHWFSFVFSEWHRVSVA